MTSGPSTLSSAAPVSTPWLVTGGAGYIGSHVTRKLRESGRRVVVLDDLSSGHRQFVGDIGDAADAGIRFVEGSVVDPAAVDAAIGAFDEPVRGVVHLAGYKYAGVSVQRPLHTYTQNVTAMQVLLERLAAHEVSRLVFSSSAATFGTPDVDLVTETTPTRPESPYGESKLIGEWLIRDVARVSALTHTSLRYFNVVGSGYADLYDSSPHNLFPLVLKALTEGRTPSVNGTDYPTPDGSCVRDYVHVDDLALAHVAAAEALEAGRVLEPVYNLGSGDGSSVIQIMDAVRRVTGIEFTPERRDRRPGDPARIVATGELAARDLGWANRHSLDDMVASAWAAWQKVTAAAR
ncbi:MAG: UDP-glucose 4-epimerase GalE [Kineosporiaceae bacterium]|nr:UDP-glucose 4-epimerase GalE [Kineosporiaceae bacterium]